MKEGKPMEVLPHETPENMIENSLPNISEVIRLRALGYYSGEETKTAALDTIAGQVKNLFDYLESRKEASN